MKKITNKILIFAIALLPGFALAQLNIDDFRGAQWGVDRANIQFDHQADPIWVREGKLGPYTVYSLKNEDLTIGSAEMSNIHYHFNEADELTRVVFNGSDDYNEDIESILASRLGSPQEMQLYQWEVVRIWEDDDVVVAFREHRDMEFEVEINSKLGVREKMAENKNITDF